MTVIVIVIRVVVVVVVVVVTEAAEVVRKYLPTHHNSFCIIESFHFPVFYLQLQYPLLSVCQSVYFFLSFPERKATVVQTGRDIVQVLV